MNNLVLPNLWRFLALVAFQVLVLKQLATATGSAYFNVLLYPLFILMLPLALPSSFAVLLGFLLGITVDFFYASPGVHASAAVFSAFARGVVLSFFEPKGGFSGKEPVIAPEYFGFQTFIQVAALFFFAHLFWYFSVEQFTFVYFGSILLKTLSAWALTMIFVVIYGLLFNPKA